MSNSQLDELTQPSKSGIQRTTLLLAIGQTVFWASTFYLLPALILDLEQNTSWTKTQLSAAMTGSILVSALCARPAGRVIDAGQGRVLMAIGGVSAGMLLLACSQVSYLWQFYLCWALIGACMASILYEPCFSIVTRHHGLNARRAITHITLIAGFAGTISFPVATWLSAQFDWRVTFIFFGFATLVLAVPSTFFAISELQKVMPVEKIKSAASQATSKAHKRSFWLITGAFTLGSMNHTMIISHMLPMLNERGISTQFAVIAAMLVGPMQVVGRLLLMTNEKHVSTRMSAFICLCGLALSTCILWVSGVNLMFIYLATSLHGATWGLVSITRPTLVREVLGQQGFGATSGAVAAIAIFGVALSPTLGAWLWALGGYQFMLGVGILFTLTGGLLIWLLTKQATVEATVRS